jgi:conjugal transfer pilus assembly protein TrbC
MRSQSCLSQARFLPLALLLTVSLALAQGASFPATGTNRLPTATEIEAARQKSADAIKRIPNLDKVQQYFGGVVPDVASIPKPITPAPDIAFIAQKYKNLGQAANSKNSGAPDLMVFVSLSMPRNALSRLIEQSELAGATLVFRGLKGNSMTQMGEAIKELIGDRTVSAVIHPPAFQQFSVNRVPVVVIAKPEASSVLEDGCSKPDTFVKVAGDVTLDYALDYMERRSPEWSSTARSFRARLGGASFQ